MKNSSEMVKKQWAEAGKKPESGWKRFRSGGDNVPAVRTIRWNTRFSALTYVFRARKNRSGTEVYTCNILKLNRRNGDLCDFRLLAGFSGHRFETVLHRFPPPFTAFG